MFKHQRIFSLCFFIWKLEMHTGEPGSLFYLVSLLFVALTTTIDTDSWHETKPYLLILIFTGTYVFLEKYAYDETSNCSFQIHEQIRIRGL